MEHHALIRGVYIIFCTFLYFDVGISTWYTNTENKKIEYETWVHRATKHLPVAQTRQCPQKLNNGFNFHSIALKISI